MNRHGLWMILACVVPFLLIFLLPLLGVGGGSGGLFFVFIILCFGMHLLMMGGHHGNGENGDEKRGRHGGH